MADILGIGAEAWVVTATILDEGEAIDAAIACRPETLRLGTSGLLDFDGYGAESIEEGFEEWIGRFATHELLDADMPFAGFGGCRAHVVGMDDLSPARLFPFVVPAAGNRRFRPVERDDPLMETEVRYSQRFLDFLITNNLIIQPVLLDPPNHQSGPSASEHQGA